MMKKESESFIKECKKEETALFSRKKGWGKAIGKKK